MATDVKPRQPWWQTLLALLVVLVAAVLAIALAVVVTRAFFDLDPGPAAAIITAGATVLLSVFSLIFSKRWERSRDLEQEHRAQKLPVYEQFIAFWFRALLWEQLGETQPTDEETARFLSEFTQKLTLWGSDGVLREYSRFRLSAAQRAEEDSESPAIMFDLENLLYEIRRDLGHHNKNLKQGDLLSFFVNDIEEYLGAQSNSRSGS